MLEGLKKAVGRIFGKKETEKPGRRGLGPVSDLSLYRYEMLSDAEKAVYEAIYEARQAGRMSCRFRPVSNGIPMKAFAAYNYDHPEDFDLIPNITFTSDTINFQTLLSPSERPSAQRKLEQVQREYASMCDGLDPENKIRAAFVYMLNHATYAIDNRNNQSTYSSLGRGRAQCSGLALGLVYLLRSQGIPSFVVDGQIDGRPHAWAMAKVNGTFYHYDVTQFIGANSSRTPPYNFVDFKSSDAEIKKDHTTSMKLPVSGPDVHEYYRDMNTLKEAVAAFLSSSRKEQSFDIDFPAYKDAPSLMRALEAMLPGAVSLAHYSGSIGFKLHGQSVFVVTKD